MVQWLMTRFVGQNHRSNAFHCVSKLATLNALKNKKFIVNHRVNLCINAKFTQLSEKEEKKTDIKDESFVKKNKPPKHGSLVTILSLDGGGVRGIIGGVILAKLEEHLQEIDENDNARIANYFDVIAGTSTGGLMTAMLTAPDPKKKGFPLYAAKEIVPFYKVESSKIFKSKWWKPVILFNLMGPRYDGEYLHKRLREILKETRLSETLTNVVLPTFDIKELQPTIFSSFQADVVEPSLDVKLSDICIGTSAAPYFLPPYEFSNEVTKGKRRTFNLLDGGVTANDPTLVGMTAMSRRSINKHPDMDGFMPLDYDKYLVISIGTGSASRQEFYSAKKAAKWGFFGWGFNWTSKQIPIIETFSESSRDMVQYHTSVLFQALKSEDNYLRIDFDELVKEEASMDNAKKSNLIKLEEVGNNLLKAKVKRMNLNTFKYELIPDREVTNCQELKRFAKLLSDERKLRMKTSETMDEDSSN